MKKYFKVASMGLLLAAILGFVLPALISAASTELVLLGVFVAIVTPPVFWKVLKPKPKRRGKKNA